MLLKRLAVREKALSNTINRLAAVGAELEFLYKAWVFDLVPLATHVEVNDLGHERCQFVIPVLEGDFATGDVTSRVLACAYHDGLLLGVMVAIRIP